MSENSTPTAPPTSRLVTASPRPANGDDATTPAGSRLGFRAGPFTPKLSLEGAGPDQPAKPLGGQREQSPPAPVIGVGNGNGNGNGDLSGGNLTAFGDASLPGLDGDGSGDLRRIIVASDHRGYAAKCRLLDHLRGELPEHTVVDFGCNDGSRACDYPDYAIPAAALVATGEYDAAVLLDGSGIGMGIAANKVRGVRAATCHDEITARIAREHNHCNALCVGVDLVGEKTLFRVVKTFLDTAFSGGRHVRRVAKLCAHEDESFAAESEQQQQQLLRRAGC